MTRFRRNSPNESNGFISFKDMVASTPSADTMVRFFPGSGKKLAEYVPVLRAYLSPSMPIPGINVAFSSESMEAADRDAMWMLSIVAMIIISPTTSTTRFIKKNRGVAHTAQKKKKENLIACRGLGRVVGPLLAARTLPLRCAASTVLSSTLLAI
jgi:hypothetical protein